MSTARKHRFMSLLGGALCERDHLKSSSNPACTAERGEWSTPYAIRKRHARATFRRFASSVAIAKKRRPLANRLLPCDMLPFREPCRQYPDHRALERNLWKRP